MKDILSVKTAIRLLGSNHAQEVSQLESIVGNIKQIEDSIPPLLANMRRSLINVVSTYSDLNISFDGVYLSAGELDKSLYNLEDQIRQIDAELNAAHEEFTRYSDVNYEPNLNTIERNAILDEKQRKWDAVKKRRDEAWHKYRELEIEVSRMKANADSIDFESFEYLSELYFAHKDEFLARLKEIPSESTRIDVESDIEKVEKLIASIKEKEQAKETELGNISKVADMLGIELEYEGKKTPITPEIEVERDAKPIIKETPVETEVKKQDAQTRTDDVQKFFDQLQQAMSEEQTEQKQSQEPVQEETVEPVESTIIEPNEPTQTFKVEKTASAIIDESAKTLFIAASIVTLLKGVTKIEERPELANAIRNLYRKVVGDSETRIPELEQTVRGEMTDEELSKLLAGIKKCIKALAKFKSGRQNNNQPKEMESEDKYKSALDGVEDNQLNLDSMPLDEILNRSRERGI